MTTDYDTQTKTAATIAAALFSRDRLRRTVGHVLARGAARTLRHDRANGWTHQLAQSKEQGAVTLQRLTWDVERELRERLEEQLKAHGIPTWLAYDHVKRATTPTRMRAAVRYWIEQNRLTEARRTGARGSKRYVWTLRGAEAARARRKVRERDEAERERAKREARRVEAARETGALLHKLRQAVYGLRGEAKNDATVTLSPNDLIVLLDAVSQPKEA